MTDDECLHLYEHFEPADLLPLLDALDVARDVLVDEKRVVTLREGLFNFYQTTLAAIDATQAAQAGDLFLMAEGLARQNGDLIAVLRLREGCHRSFLMPSLLSLQHTLDSFMDLLPGRAEARHV